MSDKPVNLSNLKTQAESLRGWFNTTDAWLDTSEDSACAVVGHISDEGTRYPVAVVDCDQYDAPSDSMKLAKFYASANPKAILELIANYEVQAQRANALALVINDLSKIVTHDGETKQQFVERVKAILSVDPDLRVSELQVAYEALQKENAELKEDLDDEKQKGAALWKNVENRCKEIDALKAENAAQAKRIAELEETNGLLQTQVHCLEMTLASKNGE